MKNNNTIELKILKAILWIYIILCIAIAALNYGYASHATEATASFIRWFWHFYENWIKTAVIIICSILTLRIIGTSSRITMRKRNLIGITISALAIHIVAPLIFNNIELYFFVMPLPWTTTPLQLLNPNSLFYISRFPLWGLTGIATALIFYVCMSVVVILGTLLFGRRWQCSTLCLLNGFAAEVFDPAIPLIGKASRLKPRTIKTLSSLKWIFLGIALFFTFYWVLTLSGIALPGDIKLIGKIETYKYLSTELLMAMFFWVAFIGRGYCYYCPLGTVMGFLAKFAGQKIVTNNTQCIQCNQCNLTCPMSIEIKEKAKTGEAVKELGCVGCGHCVDVCPTRTLSYSTKFLDVIDDHGKSNDVSI